MEEISAKVLNAMKKLAEKHLGREVKKAVVTVPAKFTQLQKIATKDACKVAGLNCVRMINEPTAAAFACGFHEYDEDLTVLIFDLGGGTFDVTIACISEGSVDVQSTDGDMMLGGRDFDEVLVKHCIEEFKTETGVDLTDNLV